MLFELPETCLPSKCEFLMPLLGCVKGLTPPNGPERNSVRPIKPRGKTHRSSGAIEPLHHTRTHKTLPSHTHPPSRLHRAHIVDNGKHPSCLHGTLTSVAATNNNKNNNNNNNNNSNNNNSKNNNNDNKDRFARRRRNGLRRRGNPPIGVN